VIVTLSIDFFKLVGRAEAIDSAQDAFDGMVESFRAR
jgi:hypothetical protein